MLKSEEILETEKIPAVEDTVLRCSTCLTLYNGIYPLQVISHVFLDCFAPLAMTNLGSLVGA